MLWRQKEQTKYSLFRKAFSSSCTAPKDFLLQALVLFSQWLIRTRYGPWPLDSTPCLHTFWLLLSQRPRRALTKFLTQEDMGTSLPLASVIHEHRRAVPDCGLTLHLRLKASSLFHLSQVRYLHPIPWLLYICLQDVIVIHVLPPLLGFDPADFQPALSFSKIVGQARDHEYTRCCGSHPNGARTGSHVNQKPHQGRLYREKRRCNLAQSKEYLRIRLVQK